MVVNEVLTDVLYVDPCLGPRYVARYGVPLLARDNSRCPLWQVDHSQRSEIGRTFSSRVFHAKSPGIVHKKAFRGVLKGHHYFDCISMRVIYIRRRLDARDKA